MGTSIGILFAAILIMAICPVLQVSIRYLYEGVTQKNCKTKMNIELGIMNVEGM